MQAWDVIKDIGIPTVASVVAWVAGRYTRRSDALVRMQTSIDLLAEKNAELITEVTELRSENANLSASIHALTGENARLKKTLDAINKKLDVKLDTYICG